MKSVLLAGFILLFTTGSGIYKWVDEKGNVHFGSAPPPKTQNIESVNIQSSSSTRSGSSEATDLYGTWYSRNKRGLIEFKVDDNHLNEQVFIWTAKGDAERKTSLSGKLQQNGVILSLLKPSGDIHQELVIRNHQATTLEVVDAKTEEVYLFRKLPDDYRELSDTEAKIVGIWAEVHPARPDIPVSWIEFKDGTFTRYRTESNYRKYPSPNRNLDNTVGTWSVEDDTLTLDYIAAFGVFSQVGYEPEQWAIARLEHRELVLRNAQTRKELHFRRERSVD